MRAPSTNGRQPLGLDLPWISLLALACIVQYWPLLARLRYHFSLNYNEGFNVHYADVVARGQGLYAQPPKFMVMGYPPFSFHTIAILAPGLGGPLVTGRTLALAGLAVITALAGYIVYITAGDSIAALFSSLLVLLCIGLYGRDYVGMNDPQMMAHAIVLVGATVYLRRPMAWSNVLAGAVIVTIGLFFKHNIIAFPVGIALALLFTNRRLFFIWSGTGLLLATVLGVIIVRMDGPFFLQSLTTARHMSRTQSITATIAFLRTLQVPVIVGMFGLVFKRHDRQMWPFSFAMLTGFAYSVFVSAANGINVNHFFDVLVVICMVCGLVFADLRRFATRHPELPKFDTIIGAFPLIFLLGFLANPVVVADFALALKGSKTWQEQAAVFAEDVRYVASHSGPAICEDLLICDDSGKNIDYDAFNVNEAVLTHPAYQGEIIARLSAKQYGVIQINRDPDEQIIAAQRVFFTKAFMVGLLENYSIERVDPRKVFFVPK